MSLLPVAQLASGHAVSRVQMALNADNGYSEASDTKHFISTATKLPEMAAASGESPRFSSLLYALQDSEFHRIIYRRE